MPNNSSASVLHMLLLSDSGIHAQIAAPLHTKMNRHLQCRGFDASQRAAIGAAIRALPRKVIPPPARQQTS